MILVFKEKSVMYFILFVQESAIGMTNVINGNLSKKDFITFFARDHGPMGKICKHGCRLNNNISESTL